MNIQVKIAIFPGTRPEIIKMSPVMREWEKRGLGSIAFNMVGGEFV